MIRFHALITFLYNERGHHFIYHRCFRSAVQKLGYAYKGYTNKNCPISNLPPDWEQCLSWKDEKRFFLKLLQFIKRLFAFSRIFAKKDKEKRIFFLESLTITDIAALSLSVFFFLRKSDYFWLLLRLDLRDHPFKEKFFRFFLKRMQKKLHSHFILLSDSERVGSYFENLLYQKVHIVPIPHTDMPNYREHSSRSIKKLWWPGDPQFGRGLKEIQSLTKNAVNDVQLSLSSKAQQFFLKARLNLCFLKPILSREEYIEQFACNDAILLPYDPQAYFSRTSGIFVEAVFAGKPPLVVEGSWLANELHRYNLPEFILDWNRPDLLPHIIELLNDQTVRTKFESMQKAYISYHSLSSYTKEIKRIFKRSQIDCT